MKKRFYSLSDYLKETYGKRLYKISLDGGFTCPNRDGTKGVGGCIFCNGEGSGEHAEKEISISESVRRAVKRYEMKEKFPKDAEYIAYFQSFTGTYAEKEKLLALYNEAISAANIRVLSVATRPDCIFEDVLEVLSEMKKKVDVWVELGLQTANDSTAKKLNRCYDTSEYERAVESLKKIGVKVITHLILGLPGETHEDEINSVKYAVNCGTDGVKFHLLYVTKNTALAKTDYSPLSFEEYVERVCDLIRFLPKKTVIHRLTGDGDKKALISPLWSLEKIEVLNAISHYLEENDILQGENLE